MDAKEYAAYANHVHTTIGEEDEKSFEEYIEDAFNAGKQEVIKDAKCGVGNNDNYIQFEDGTWIDLDPSLLMKPAFCVKEGDKVKVIILKEE